MVSVTVTEPFLLTLISDCDDSVRVQNDLTSARKSSNIVDWDGSVTGITGGAIIGSWAGIWNGGPDCHFDWNWLTWVCPRKPVSPPKMLKLAR